MKKRDYVILGLVGVLAFLLGSFLFPSGNSESNFQITDSSECKWENYKQGIFAGSNWIYNQELSQSAFLTPRSISYDEVEFTGLGVVATTIDDNLTFFLNGQECGELRRDELILNDFSETCSGALNEGFNFFNTSSRRDVIVHEVFIEMRYKPANCDN